MREDDEMLSVAPRHLWRWKNRRFASNTGKTKQCTCARHQGSASHGMIPQVCCRSCGQAGFKHCHAALSMLRFEAGEQGVHQGRDPVALLHKRQPPASLP